jgi:dynein heavy chain, axonemal
MFLNLPVNTIEAVFEDTNFKTPLIFILSSGADPLFNLQRFARERSKPADLIYLISLGQG